MFCVALWKSTFSCYSTDILRAILTEYQAYGINRASCIASLNSRCVWKRSATKMKCSLWYNPMYGIVTFRLKGGRDIKSPSYTYEGIILRKLKTIDPTNAMSTAEQNYVHQFSGKFCRNVISYFNKWWLLKRGYVVIFSVRHETERNLSTGFVYAVFALWRIIRIYVFCW